MQFTIRIERTWLLFWIIVFLKKHNMVTHKHMYSHLRFLRRQWCACVHTCMSTFICSTMCNYSKHIWSHQQHWILMYLRTHKYVDNDFLNSRIIFYIFHINIFMHCGNMLLVHKNVSNSLTNLWPSLEITFSKNQNVENFHVENFHFRFNFWKKKRKISS